MKLSHSKLNTIMTCPMSYYLNYEQGIKPKVEKAAFTVGSAVHWGLEHGTDDLTEYWASDFKSRDSYGKDQLLAESMVHGYLNHKDELFAEIMKDPDGEGELEILEEYHELEIYGDLPSRKFEEPHKFMGIIDLLFLTNKGFVVIDYKTSSRKPDWDKYLEQIYRYIFLLKCNFPDVPVIRCGIVNLIKINLRQKANESNESYLNRLRIEYELNEEECISSHMFESSDINPALMEEYFDNLSVMADTAQTIRDNRLFFINYNNAVSVYGKSDYWDIFYHTPDAYLLYKIKDTVVDEYDGSILTERDCVPLDMKCIEMKPILNHYSQFEELIAEYREKSGNESELLDLEYPAIVELAATKFDIDEGLLERYWNTMRALSRK